MKFITTKPYQCVDTPGWHTWMTNLIVNIIKKKKNNNNTPTSCVSGNTWLPSGKNIAVIDWILITFATKIIQTPRQCAHNFEGLAPAQKEGAHVSFFSSFFFSYFSLRSFLTKEPPAAATIVRTYTLSVATPNFENEAYTQPHMTRHGGYPVHPWPLTKCQTFLFLILACVLPFCSCKYIVK